MPIQNDGVAMPPMANTRTATSSQVFCFSAEIAPSGMAIEIATTVASIAISSEIGSRASDFRGHRLARPHRGAEVEAEEAPDEVNELQQHRAVHAEFGMAGGDRPRIEAAAAGPQAHHADVAGDQPHQQEHQRRRPDQRRDHQQHALEDVAVHLLVQPDIRQILIEVMARADLPAFHVGPHRHDAIPPGHHQLVRANIDASDARIRASAPGPWPRSVSCSILSYSAACTGSS